MFRNPMHLRRLYMSRAIVLLLAALVSLAPTATGVAATATRPATTQRLVHKKMVDLSQFFDVGLPDGAKPRSMTFDGTDAYVGGANYGNPTVGIIRIKALVDAPAAPEIASLKAARFRAADNRGFDALAFHAADQSLYCCHDSGYYANSFIRRLKPDDGATAWEITQFEKERPVGIAIDPLGTAGKPALAYLMAGANFDRQLRWLSLDAGQHLDTAETGGMVDPAPERFKRRLRALSIDNDGNIALAATGGFAYGRRAHDKGPQSTWVRSDGSAGTSSILLLDEREVFMSGQSVALMEIPSTGALLICSAQSKRAHTLQSADGQSTPIEPSDVQIRRIDGSTTNLVQTSLKGDEDKIGAKWADDSTTWSKSFWCGQDARGRRILLVLELIQCRLDVYELVQ